MSVKTEAITKQEMPSVEEELVALSVVEEPLAYDVMLRQATAY